MKKKIFILIAAIIIIAGMVVWYLGAKSGQSQIVVVYTSEDQVFSEPILKDFERDTGIRVKAVYDTEETKSTGVMNRLMAEKNNPQADVYWANEPVRAEGLRQMGIAAAYISPNAKDIPAVFKNTEGYWTGFSARARVLIVNQQATDKPDSISAYVDLRWKGKAVMANPIFGTTTNQIAALFSIWGDQKTEAFMDDLKKNNVKISTSNGESADLVASGEFNFSLVDSDDVINRIKQGKPVQMVYPDQGENEIGCLILPNVTMLIKGAPHPEAGKKLVNYLLSRDTERKLAYADCAQIPLNPGVDTPPEVPDIRKIKTMPVNYADLANKLHDIQPYLKKWAGY